MRNKRLLSYMSIIVLYRRIATTGASRGKPSPHQFQLSRGTVIARKQHADCGVRKLFRVLPRHGVSNSRTRLAGTVLIFPNAYQVFFDGTCETRDPLGQVVAFGTGACTFFAADNTSNGAVDSLSAFSGSGSGYVQACCTPASGNVNVE